MGRHLERVEHKAPEEEAAAVVAQQEAAHRRGERPAPHTASVARGAMAGLVPAPASPRTHLHAEGWNTAKGAPSRPRPSAPAATASRLNIQPNSVLLATRLAATLATAGALPALRQKQRPPTAALAAASPACSLQVHRTAAGLTAQLAAADTTRAWVCYQNTLVTAAACAALTSRQLVPHTTSPAFSRWYVADPKRSCAAAPCRRRQCLRLTVALSNDCRTSSHTSSTNLF